MKIWINVNTWEYIKISNFQKGRWMVQNTHTHAHTHREKYQVWDVRWKGWLAGWYFLDERVRKSFGNSILSCQVSYLVDHGNHEIMKPWSIDKNVEYQLLDCWVTGVHIYMLKIPRWFSWSPSHLSDSHDLALCHHHGIPYTPTHAGKYSGGGADEWYVYTLTCTSA